MPIWARHLLSCHYLAEELPCRPRKLALAWPLGQVRAGPLADAPRPFSSCSPAAPRRKMRAASMTRKCRYLGCDLYFALAVLLLSRGALASPIPTKPILNKS